MASEVPDPLQLLQEDLKDDDLEQVIASANRIGLVASSLGAERTRTALIPYLGEYANEDNDEARTAIARQLGEFMPLIGGPTHGKLLLPILEKLCGEEEVVVRDAAVHSLTQLAGQFRKEDLKDYVAMIQRLAGSPWFATRVSAAGIVPACYAAATDAAMQEELRRIFKALASDETPMVRKAAYLRLGEYAASTKPFFTQDVLPIIKKLVADPADSMRVLTVDIIAAVADFLPPAQNESTLLPLIEALEDDTSWRVRNALVKKLPVLCKCMGPTVAVAKLVPLFVKILKDKEAEVRASAASVMGEIGVEVKGSEALLAPCLDALATDPIQTVRIKAANTMVHLCKRFSKESASKVVIPLLKQLAKDENYEVRASIISEIDKLAEYVDPSAISSVFPLLVDLSKDAKWRVRAAVIDKSAMLAKHLGVKKFEKQLQNIVLSALSDHVFAIREKACVQLGLIVKLFTGKWAAEKLFPLAFAIYDKNANYLYRMTCLLLIQHVVGECPPDVVEKLIMPIALLAATDDVANVRIAAAKTFSPLVSRLDSKLVKAKISPVLAKLGKDPDSDVSFFANKTMRDNRNIV